MVGAELVEQLRGSPQKSKALGSRLVSRLLPYCCSGVMRAFPSLSLWRCLRHVVSSTVVGVLYRVVVHLHTVSHAVGRQKQNHLHMTARSGTVHLNLRLASVEQGCVVWW
jgi:hypothetical protein